MNPMHQMKDPAAGVPPQLLPHMHLVSKHRYPQNNNPSLETIVGYLLEAPKIMHDVALVQWQMLDCPGDGTLMLTWQPQELGTNFASDGYVFHDHEQMFNSDVRGYNLQMYLYRSGFRPGADAVASHSRRRYRLIPSQQNVGGPIPDPSLWLIHYSKAAQRDHIPAASIPVLPQIHTQLQQRRMIISQGALTRKEFMLRDRANWPTITPPGGIARPGTAGQAGPGGHRRGPSVGMAEPTVEEEEDVSRGDALDFMTPRDISRMRYEQHHEWMEEILESPYTTSAIIPPELGLGRKGELESLTRDFFGAPITVQETTTNGYPARVGKLEAGKAEEFTRLANQRLADMQAELDKMKQAHEQRMERLRKTSFIAAAERKLRTTSSDSGRQKSLSYAVGASPADTPDALDEIVKEVEAATGKKVERVKPVTCISKGGFQEMAVTAPVAIDRSQSSLSPVKSSVPMNKLAATTTQQQPPPQQPAKEQPQATMATQQNNTDHASITTSSMPNMSANQQVDGQGEDQGQRDDGLPGSGDDIDMAGADEMEMPDEQIGDVNDWVMVDDQDAPNTSGDGHVSPEGEQGQTSGSGLGLTPAGQEAQHQTIQQPEEPPIGQTPLDDFDMGNDFDDVNTAGDALNDYGADDLNLDMDNSAFGDAFHHQEDDDIS